MLLQRPLSILTLAVAAALPLALPTAALAQPGYVRADSAVTAFGVTPVNQLRPGEVLAFRLDGTPNAQVSLQITGASVPLQLAETSPGRYAGEYTIRQRDRLTAASMVTARVERNGQVSNATLSQSLQAGAPGPATPHGSPISSFRVSAPERVQAGDELQLALQGTPGGQASASVQGVAQRIPLAEVRPGEYEATYVVRRNDKLRGAVVADGRLLVNRRESTLRYDTAQQGSIGNGKPVLSCAHCGSVVSVNRVTVKGDSPNTIGTIAGGVLGGVLGNQVGGGSGRDLATIAGALGGAYAGNRVQNNMDKKTVHRVSVRLDDGTTRSFDYADVPGLAVGARVRVENNVLARI
jgi:outer membrane lipoprotein SlyB